jgi:hypothetical protein
MLAAFKDLVRVLAADPHFAEAGLAEAIAEIEATAWAMRQIAVLAIPCQPSAGPHCGPAPAAGDAPANSAPGSESGAGGARGMDVISRTLAPASEPPDPPAGAAFSGGGVG